MKRKSYPKGHFIAMGLAIGFPIGMLLGILIDMVAIGPALGSALGISLGVVLEYKLNPHPLVFSNEHAQKRRKFLTLLLGGGLVIFIGLSAFFMF